MNPTDVSNQEPQLQPPPASGESSIPLAGIVLNQHPGRSRFQLVVLPDVLFQAVTLPLRKNSAFVVAA